MGLGLKSLEDLLDATKDIGGVGSSVKDVTVVTFATVSSLRDI